MSSTTLADLPALKRAGARPRRARLKLTDWLPLILILSLLFPYRIEAGPLLLSPNRVYLLLMLLPCALAFMAGMAGRLLVADLLILAHALWTALAFFRVHGAEEALEPAGIHLVEVMGSYLIARCFVRSPESFHAVVSVLFFSIVIMLPLMLAENITGRHYLNDLLTLVAPTITPHEMEPRLGLERAFGVFDHPILLGVYCVSIFSLIYYVLGHGARRLTALIRTGLVAVATACSLSAGPLLALVIQSVFMGWDHLTRRMPPRWLILGGIFAFLYVLIDLLSNRTPFHVIVSYLTFNTGSAYSRILVWNFGSAEVARHPFFGLGLGDWDRPEWMSGSMDNFWLVLAVRGGLPAFLFFAGAILTLCIAVARLRLQDPRLIAWRRGWMIAILGLVIAGCTVHYWKTIFCLLVFLIGSFAWVLDKGVRAASVREAPGPEARQSRPARARIRFG